MNAPTPVKDPVKDIANAVLYEGYILYPYRPSSIKNRQRWTFGGVFPQSFTMLSGSDPSAMQTEVLLRAKSDASLDIQVRFLHLVTREIFAGENGTTSVESLAFDNQSYAPGEEAIEREIDIPTTTLAGLNAEPHRMVFAFPASRETQPLPDSDNRAAGSILRTTRELEGMLTVSAQEVSPRTWRVRLRVENTSPVTHDECESRALAQRHSFTSTHAILRIRGGDFVSLTDPPDDLAEVAHGCVQEGCWPVLVGREGSHDTLLASPIILYDYPQIAPESPGDLFDGCEIDEILTLRILTMTDAEKTEAAGADPRVAALLQRTESLSEDDMAKMHGALRTPRAFPKPVLASLNAGGGELAVGARVRLKPKPGGDIFDIVLAGKIAIIEAIERDFEDRVHVAVTIEDDPGREFGMDRFPGHRFFFSREEIEPVGEEIAA